MGLKGLRLSVALGKKLTDPIDLFNKLTLRGSIQNIWEPQADAPREWNRVRAASDVVVQMNTGGGKTLVGLVIAQALLNELNKRVLYVVPNNQLVEQTLKPRSRDRDPTRESIEEPVGQHGSLPGGRGFLRD